MNRPPDYLVVAAIVVAGPFLLAHCASLFLLWVRIREIGAEKLRGKRIYGRLSYPFSLWRPLSDWIVTKEMLGDEKINRLYLMSKATYYIPLCVILLTYAIRFLQGLLISI